jgi:hypothetical protein
LAYFAGKNDAVVEITTTFTSNSTSICATKKPLLGYCSPLQDIALNSNIGFEVPVLLLVTCASFVLIYIGASLIVGI